MSFTVFLGNLPTWVTADDIQSWLNAEALVADSIKVIRNPETQESKGFAFIEAPNGEEMQSIIRRFDRAPLEDKLLRANPAQPPKGKGLVRGPEERRFGPPAGPRTDRGPREGGYAGARQFDSRPDSRPAGDRGMDRGMDRPVGDRPMGDRPPASQSVPAAGNASTTERPMTDRAAAASASGNPSTGNTGNTGTPPLNAADRAAAERNRAAKRRTRPSSGTSAFAEELAKAL